MVDVQEKVRFGELLQELKSDFQQKHVNEVVSILAQAMIIAEKIVTLAAEERRLIESERQQRPFDLHLALRVVVNAKTSDFTLRRDFEGVQHALNVAQSIVRILIGFLSHLEPNVITEKAAELSHIFSSPLQTYLDRLEVTVKAEVAAIAAAKGRTYEPGSKDIERVILADKAKAKLRLQQAIDQEIKRLEEKDLDISRELIAKAKALTEIWSEINGVLQSIQRNIVTARAQLVTDLSKARGTLDAIINLKNKYHKKLEEMNSTLSNLVRLTQDLESRLPTLGEFVKREDSYTNNVLIVLRTIQDTTLRPAA